MGLTPRTSRWAALLVVPALLFAGCAGDDKSDQNQAGSTKAGGVFRIGIVEPTAIDPYNSQESEGILVTKQLFVGLVRVNDETAELTPGVAEKWAKNDACTEWTFNLRSGTTFSNGDPVNAEAFIRGMTRAAKQKAASDVAYHMAGIEGYEAIHGSGAENAPPATAQTFSGLSAPDANTLEVWAGALGEERAARGFSFGNLERFGARLVFGSDWPVVPPDVLGGLYTAVTRQTRDGKPPGGWLPGQVISLESALKHYTLDGAYASFEEGQKGTLAVGKLADLVVLSRDITQAPPAALLDTKVLLTVMDGKVMYEMAGRR